MHLENLSALYNERINLSLQDDYFGEGFFLKNENDDYIQLNIPLDHNTIRKNETTHPYKPEDYEVCFLLKKNIKEIEIHPLQYKIGENYSNIGFLIPIISLESNNHPFADDEYFSIYSYIAIIESLKAFPTSGCLEKIEFDNQIKNLSDCLHPDIAICVIWKKNIPDFSYYKMSHFFFENGYVRLTNRPPEDLVYFTPETPEDSIQGNQIDSSEPLKIKFLSEHITEPHLVDKILFSRFPYEKNPPFKFFLLYQIIELMMGYILKNEYKLILRQITENQDDYSKSRDILEKLQDTSSEKKRIKLLLNVYSSTIDEIEELKINAHSYVLKAIDSSIGDDKDCFEYFYRIRNFIVHNLMSIEDINDEDLEKVTGSFINVIPSLLCNFKNRNLA